MSEPTNLVQHLDPTKDKFNIAGIALLAEGHNPTEVRDFYHNTGVLPDIHPVVLYEVKPRGADGHRLTRALISLEDGLTLNLSTHFFYVAASGSRFSQQPSPEDIQLARRTLEMIGLLQYETLADKGDGTKIKIPVQVTKQIEDFLGLHLATPVEES